LTHLRQRLFLDLESGANPDIFTAEADSVGHLGCVVFNMKKITALEVQKKNPNRVNLHLDGEFAFGLARITAAWLKVGDVLSDEKIAKLQNEDAQEKAMQQALLFLKLSRTFREGNTAEPEKARISRRRHRTTLTRLRDNRLANDNEFAQAWVENRSTFRPRSRRALTMELRQKGLDEETVQAAVSNVDEEALAYETARKRAPRFKGLEWSEFRKKLSESPCKARLPLFRVTSSRHPHLEVRRTRKIHGKYFEDEELT
jgi:regulatory protein